MNMNFYFLFTIAISLPVFSTCSDSEENELCQDLNNLNHVVLNAYSKSIVPDFDGKRKGEAGKIGIIGGSTEYTGAPYFAAIAALKVGADLVFVFTTENAAPVIKSYSPDLIVHPILNFDFLPKLKSLIRKLDVVVIGPGLGRENETLELVYAIIDICRDFRKPLVIDADGLYAVSKNVSVLNHYPHPGVILTPNYHEVEFLKEAVPSNSTWYSYWGDSVAALVKGKEDRYFCTKLISPPAWSVSKGGSNRRVGGQGDILAGALGTWYNWALKRDFCHPVKSLQLSQSVATYAAARFTRTCNFKAFVKHGRSMTASDMLNEIHAAFDELFVC